MLATQRETIGTSLDALLAPLDEIVPLAQFPTERDMTKAYALGCLAADLTANAPNMHLIQVCQHLGWEQGEALTIGRALASLLVRLAQYGGSSRIHLAE